MDAREQLLYLIEHYHLGNYSTEIFAEEFFRIYVHEVDFGLLTAEERELFGGMSQITGRFSPYEEDVIKYRFYDKDDVQSEAEKIYDRLFRANRAQNFSPTDP